MPTVKITGVFLIFQIWNKFCFLSKQSIPVQILKESMLFDLLSTTRTKSLERIVLKKTTYQILCLHRKVKLVFWPFNRTCYKNKRLIIIIKQCSNKFSESQTKSKPNILKCAFVGRKETMRNICKACHTQNDNNTLQNVSDNLIMKFNLIKSII